MTQPATETTNEIPELAESYRLFDELQAAIATIPDHPIYDQVRHYANEFADVCEAEIARLAAQLAGPGSGMDDSGVGVGGPPQQGGPQRQEPPCWELRHFPERYEECLENLRGGREGGGTPINPDFRTQELDCESMGELSGVCRDTLIGVQQGYNAFLERAIEEFGVYPTMEDLIAITIYGEWWGQRSNPVINRESSFLVQDYGTEAIARAYYEFASEGMYTSPEDFFLFLSGYQPWLLGGYDPELVAEERMQDWQGVLQLTEEERDTMNAIVSEILDPIDESWRQGQMGNRPWQWFTFSVNLNDQALQEIARERGTSREDFGFGRCQVLTRVITRPGEEVFEMYTAAQRNTIWPEIYEGVICEEDE